MSSSKNQSKITLHRGYQTYPGFAPSPFVSKLEARLRFSNVSYTAGSEGPFKAPRGKIPFVVMTKTDSTGQPLGESVKLGDSRLIADHIVNEGVAEDLNARLLPAMRFQDLAIRGLLEERLYWLECYERWVENFYDSRSMILQGMPYPAQVLVGLLVYRHMKSALDGQGTTRFTPDEIRAFRLEIWQSLEATLADVRNRSQRDGPFWVLGGGAPTEADATLFGFIASDLMCPS